MIKIKWEWAGLAQKAVVGSYLLHLTQGTNDWWQWRLMKRAEGDLPLAVYLDVVSGKEFAFDQALARVEEAFLAHYYQEKFEQW